MPPPRGPRRLLLAAALVPAAGGLAAAQPPPRGWPLALAASSGPASPPPAASGLAGLLPASSATGGPGGWPTAGSGPAGAASPPLASSGPAGASSGPATVEPPARFGPPVVHALGLLTLQRVAEAYLYPQPFAELHTWPQHYRDSFTLPPIFDPHKPAFRWDGDPVFINVVGHGIMGSELYLRARQCHFGRAGSLAFAAVSTVAWEYLFEGNGVRPSTQDLVYTPIAGLVLGEARYLGWSAAGGIGQPVVRGILRAVLDPFGEIERGTGLAGC